MLTPRADLRTTVLGTTFDLPFLLAPIGSTRMFHPHGEALSAAAAGAAGTGYILSTLCGSPLEEVKAAATRPVWYQLYLVGGHDVARAGIERARKAGFSALVVTIDTPVAGHARARSPQRHQRAADTASPSRCCRSSRSCSRVRAGWRGSSPTAA